MAQDRAATERPMAGKTVVMTGGTSGLGREAALELARRGARLVLVARDAGRADDMLARLRSGNASAEPARYLADLSSLAETRRVAAALCLAEPRIDVLVNNAGAIFSGGQRTPEGLEPTFATNHMSAFVLTLGLRKSLAAAGGARVVTTASAAHRMADFDRKDVPMLGESSAWRAYGRSKLYNILFTRELARRWAGSGITANCFHPGVVATRFGDAAGSWMSPVIRLAKLFAIPPEKGARTLVYLASAPELAGVTGRYFEKCRAVEPTKAGQDDAAAALIWAESARVAGLPD